MQKIFFKSMLDKKSIAMKKFEPYEAILGGYLNSKDNSKKSKKYFKKIDLTLDGQPSSYLREKIKLETLQHWGAFFTGHKLATKLVSPFKKDLLKGVKILDPACGAGDLLIACAKYLPIKKNFFKTISYWENLLYGFDVHSQFVNTTKLRLALLAKKRCNFTGKVSLNKNNLFKNIKTADFINSEIKKTDYKIIVTNPPFIYKHISSNCDWSSGLTSVAGLFIQKCITISNKGTQIAAILPDVLRSGTRYEKWRKFIQGKTKIIKSKIVGKFDKLTDIDVFRLYLIVGHSSKKPIYSTFIKSKNVLGDIFETKVGPVVPFRDAKRGNKYPFIEPSNVQAWKEVIPRKSFRKFNKTVFVPPFIVVRRTSGPNDKIRAVGSIIKGKKEVAVENHFIVLLPKKGGIKICRDVLKVLKMKTTTNWLNDKIRCRHLTVSSLANIPLRAK